MFISLTRKLIGGFLNDSLVFFQSSSISAMDTQQPPHRLPEIKFRVLIIGRANAGKTSILQKVCDTTKSPVIYRGTGGGRKRFCYSADFVSRLDPIKLDPSIEVSDVASSVGYY